MKSFWSNIYDAVKDRNYGLLFFGTLLGLIGGVCVIGFIAMEIGPVSEIYFLWSVGGFGVLTIVMALVSIRRAWRRRTDRANIGVLSRDEIQKARSKLRGRTPAPMRKLPDVDLKY